MPSEPEKHDNTKPVSRAGNGRWAKGSSGNPNGKPPKDLTLTTLLKAKLQEVMPGDKQGRTWREGLVLAVLTGAMKGNPMLLKELFDRLDGKPAQAVTGEGGGPVLIRVVFENKPS